MGFDLTELAVKAHIPSNDVLYDDAGMPSIMVKIPKMTYADLGLSESTDTFPAFIISGNEVDAIYISKYQNIVRNGRAYSLPGQDPEAGLNFDESLAVCKAKGNGWHLMTAFEWGLLIALCEKNGIMPNGNTNHGKYALESDYKAIPSNTPDNGKYANHTAAGSGPLTWFHDQTPEGIADLCGNVYEWIGGIRAVKGELQIIQNNNAANRTTIQSASSTAWKAIKASTGELITPSSGGATGGAVKLSYVNSVLTYATTMADTGSHTSQFKNIAFASGISANAKALLIALGMAPKSDSIIPAARNNCRILGSASEFMVRRGGSYAEPDGGLASFAISNSRTSPYAGYCGFRSAYYVPA